MKYKLLRTVANVGYRGEVVDVEKGRISADQGIPLDEVEPEPVEDEKSYDEMSKAELVEVCKENELDTSGTKADLLERIQLAEQE